MSRILTLVSLGLTVYTLARVGMVLAAVYAFAQGTRLRAWSLEGWLSASWYIGGVVAILLAHEGGHWWAARRAGLTTKGPFFVPVPLGWTFGWLPACGTLGAYLHVARLSSVSPAVRWQIAIAGPLAGLAVTLVCLTLGGLWTVESRGPFGRPFTSSAVEWLLGQGAWHPIAFAGWVGALITGVNLFPIVPWGWFPGTDGGHLIDSARQLSARYRWATLGAMGLMAACLV